MPADVFNNWLVDTVPHAPHPIPAATRVPEKADRPQKSPAGSAIRGAVDLGGVTFAAPEK
jgi:hypothetical protein